MALRSAFFDTNANTVSGGGITGNLAVSYGSSANVPTLNFGQMYFANDSNQLYFGTPGIGIGYIQIGDTKGVNETLLQILSELRSMRLALTHLACEGGLAGPLDFDPKNLLSDSEIADQQQI
jgi:hypothetical protein